ncbi:unnamed protein product [Musa hybrid cultivar]
MWWRSTPYFRRETPRSTTTATGADLAGFAMCLNPLVRPSPGRRQILDFRRYSEGALPARPPAGSEVALCPDRSRNLADVRGFRQRFGPIIARYSPSCHL